MKYRNDLIPGIVLAILSAGYLFLSGQVDVFKESGATPLDSRFIPRLWGTALLILSIILIIRGLRTRKNEIAAGKQNSIEILGILKEKREVILSFAMLTVYIIMMEPVGFLISTALYIDIQTMILTPKEKRNFIKPLLVAILFACVIDSVFVQFLNVMLPAGLIGF